MTGLAFLGFLLVAALLYWRCRSAAARIPTQAGPSVSLPTVVIDISAAQAMLEAQRSAPLDAVSSSLIALLHEKSRLLQTYDTHLRAIADDPTLRRALERLRAEDLRQLQQLQEQLQQHLHKQVEQAPKAA